MDRKLVQQRINNYSMEHLHEWRKHAEKCLNYYTKYRDEFEISECNFIITKIDERLKELGDD